jgi:peptidoglycan/xylan/chitin deacetylase (PgdA/CDA1 family)
MDRRIATLSLDLDDKWCYMKIHGDKGWESFPSYFNLVVPRALKFLDEHDLKITFMVVGQDAAFERNRPILKSIVDAGHEIGNHSFHHESWLHMCNNEEIKADLIEAEKAIENTLGYRPIGFRGPGFSISYEVASVLVQRGYIYDGSIFPTFIGPFARAYYFMRTKLSPLEKAKRKHLFGTFRDGFRTNVAYPWMKDGHSLMIIPVTTFPILKIPIHISYILYLSLFHPALGLFYFETAMRVCRWLRIRPSMLLHPLDFIGVDDNQPEVAFFPAMAMQSEKKLHIVGQILEILKKYYSVIPMGQYAQEMLSSSTWPVFGIR